MKLLIALIASALMVSACSLQQDPLDGVDDQVAEGGLPDQNKPIQPKPRPKEGLQIDSPNQVDGQVGQPIEFKISGRVMYPGVDFELMVDNLADFPGATFDAATGEFRWIPTHEMLAGAISAQFTLRVGIRTLLGPNESVSNSEAKVITFNVMNSFRRPTIKAFTGNDIVEGGKSFSYKFEIEDLDAKSKDDVDIVTRACTSNSAYDSLSSYAYIDRTFLKDMNNGTFEGVVALNLRQVSSLRAGKYCFAIAAIAKSGLTSATIEKVVTYDPELKSPRSTMDKTLQIFVGEVKTVAFSVYDPTAVNSISVKVVEDLAKDMPGSSIQCTSDAYNQSLAYCEAVVDARNAKSGYYKARLEVETTSRTSTRKITSTNYFSVNVKEVKP
ncbi:hypothetical protein [Bdellovibrio sp. HCB2-146]|uniref:hypothetical protein n=1 Tax=Bdellovibrio sp. HCB2-146 TaxID=3394362 RepID=UPI0039BCC81B